MKDDIIGRLNEELIKKENQTKLSLFLWGSSSESGTDLYKDRIALFLY